MKRFKLLSIFLFGLYSINGQELANEKYDSLILQAEWRYFISKRDSFLLQKAAIQQSFDQYHDALFTLQRVRRLPDSLLFQQALLYYLTAQYERVPLLVLQRKAAGAALDKYWCALDIASKIQLGRWQDARSEMIENLTLLGLSQEQVDQLLTSDDQWKSGNKAFTLSVFFPGIGQWYAGHPVKGITSGVLQATSVGFALYSFYTGHFISGALTGVGLFYTFYLGGARYAEILTNERNARLSDEKVIALMNLVK